MQQVSKLFDCRRRVARIVVVGVGVDQHAALSDLAAIIDPTAEVSGAINKRSCPRSSLSAHSICTCTSKACLQFGHGCTEVCKRCEFPVQITVVIA